MFIVPEEHIVIHLIDEIFVSLEKDAHYPAESVVDGISGEQVVLKL